MAYATLQDLITRFGERRIVELTDRFDPPAEVVDESVVALALRLTADEIDGYVRGRYALPFDPVPPQLNGLAIDIAYFRLFREPTDDARKGYDAALKSLVRISDGTIKLSVQGGAAEAPSSPVVISTRQQPRLFDRASMRGL